jgi:hypothetical protein
LSFEVAADAAAGALEAVLAALEAAGALGLAAVPVEVAGPSDAHATSVETPARTTKRVNCFIPLISLARGPYVARRYYLTCHFRSVTPM